MVIAGEVVGNDVVITGYPLTVAAGFVVSRISMGRFVGAVETGAPPPTGVTNNPPSSYQAVIEYSRRDEFRLWPPLLQWS